MKLSWSAYFARRRTSPLPAQGGVAALVSPALGPGAHNADVEDPMLPCLMSPRLWSAPSWGFSTLGSPVAEVR
jgi:hypothetical protein